MAANITEYLSKLQELAKQNLNLLKSIDAAFHTKTEYVTATVGDTTFNIPSFLSLENRLNTLQANFENLVEAPKTGTASFVFDGNTKTIQCGGFNICPDKVNLTGPGNFYIENNDVLKDFMTPRPYVKFSVAEIPNNISYCQVKKIVIFNSELKNLIYTDSQPTRSVEYAVIKSLLENYTEDEDYQEYDTTVRLPLRDNIGRGTYLIEKIISTDLDSTFEQRYTLQIDNVSYTVDGTLSKRLKVGDVLVTQNDECELEIESINILTNILTVKVLHNGFSNLMDYESGGDLGKLKFYSSLDYDNNKHIDVALEENEYIIVFIAPIYDTLNTRAEWSNGIAIDTYSLTVDIDGEEIYFKDYYDANVVNIGDGLINIVSEMGPVMSSYTKDEFDTWTAAKPEFGNFTVTQINSHLSNSETYKQIKSLYLTKASYKNQLEQTQTQIDDVNTKLKSVDFDDTENLRSVYEAQLKTLNNTKTSLQTSINSIIKEISNAVSGAEIPIENAKYHIRSIFDDEAFKSKYNITCNIISLKILYRYKNALKETGQALTIDSKTYSDWNLIETNVIKRRPTKRTLTNFIYEQGTQDGPQPTYIDIPISQGETVDVKIQVVYEPGYPFVEWSSQWSDITNISFPEEFTQDVTILDIIEENNEDVKSYQFTTYLQQEGITSHCSDSVQDQDILYYHKPEDISSGFYTEERRIIPLKDKLIELNEKIQELEDIINDSHEKDVVVYLGDEIGFEQKLQAFAANTYQLQESKSSNCVTYNNSGIKTTNITRNKLYIRISNESSHTVRLFAVQKGSSNTEMTGNYNGVLFRKNITLNSDGKWFSEDSSSKYTTAQSQNAIIAFPKKDIFTGDVLDSMNTSGSDYGAWNVVNTVTNTKYIDYTAPESFVSGPFFVLDDDTKNKIYLNSGSVYYNTLMPDESLTIPLYFDSYIPETSNDEISRTVQFTIKPMANLDSITYEVVLKQKYENNLDDNLRRFASSNKYSSTNI